MTKTARYFWRFLTTFARRRKRLIIIGFLTGVLAFFFLPRFLRLLPERQQTESIGLVGRYTLENIPHEIQKQISLGLTRLEADGTPVPGLAKEWQVEKEGTVYTFKLNESLIWHDGKPIKAQDINYNFQDAQMKILDPKTVQFVLKEPFSAFPVIVSRPIFKKGLIGAGPYRVKKITRHGQFVEQIFLNSNETKKPNFNYRFYTTETAAKTAFKLSEVESLENIIDPSGLENWKNLQITAQIHADRYMAVFFNTSKPFLEDKGFRQALAYAIPKETQNRALGPINPSSWAYNQDVKPYEQNLTNAKNLLAKAIGENKEISINLKTAPSLIAEAEKIKKAWEALGIKVNVGPMTFAGEDFEALLAIQEIPPDPDQYTLWHSTQKASNITQFKNPRIDKLLEDGRKTLDKEQRRKIYYDFQRFLVEEVPAVFLTHPTLWEISRK